MAVRRQVVGALLAMLAGAAGASDVFWAGRTLDETRDARFTLEGGAIVEMSGFVNETHRALYDVTGNTYKQNPEGYDLETDFKVDGGDPVVGLGFEKAWKYVTFEGRVLGMAPETDAVARRNYYLTVDDVSLNGVSYDHIKIEEGTPFHAEFVGALFEFNGLITPVTIWMNETARFTPWAGLGVFGLAGSYEIDAGPARGTTIYQNPPEVFVVGGTATGDLIGALPELVGGGELVFGSDGGTHFALQAYVGYFAYDGGSGYFSSVDQGYEKNVEIDHIHARVRGSFDFPLSSGRALTAGGQFEYLRTQAVLQSTADTPEEILERQERYDKESDIRMSLLTAFVGLTF